MLLLCNKCKKLLNENAFYKSCKSKTGYRQPCKNCIKENAKSKPPLTEKVCGRCGILKPISEFDKCSHFGYQSYCKQCKKEKRNLQEKYEPVQEGTKICSCCKKEKSIEEFCVARNIKGGRSNTCRECKAEYDAKRRFSIQQTGTKFCPRCKQTLPIENFSIARGNPDGRFYCCKKCATKYQQEIVDKICIYCGKSFRGKREIDYACPNCKSHTVPENEFIQALNDYNIKFTTEYNLDNKYWYDFYLPDYNMLVDVSPTETHCAYTNNTLFIPKLPEYHYNRLQTAKQHNMKYINIWAWIDNTEIAKAIVQNTLQIKEGNIQKHWGKEKTSKHVLDNNFDEQEMIAEGWVPLYDDGITLIY